MSLRRYTVSIDERSYTIDLVETAADRFEVSVDGRVFEATIVGEHDVPSTEISPAVIGLPPAGAATAATPAAQPRIASVAERPVPPAPRLRSARPGADLLSAPMPGVVLEVFVAAGAEIHRGDPVLVLEAMKMRNTIRAPRDAVVAEVAVAAGQPVGTGDPLVRLREPRA
jgi:biotin carboxyl carrier protein